MPALAVTVDQISSHLLHGRPGETGIWQQRERPAVMSTLRICAWMALARPVKPPYLQGKLYNAAWYKARIRPLEQISLTATEAVHG